MKKTKLIYILCLPGFVNRIEKKLSDFSLDGWKLILKLGCRFTFIESTPKKRRYVLYTKFDCSKGIDYHFFSTKNKYKINKSKLNNCCDIFEVDLSKIDSEFDRFIKARTHYFIKRYIYLSIYFAILEAISIVITYQTKLWFVPVFMVIPLLYSIVSLITLVKT